MTTTLSSTPPLEHGCYYADGPGICFACVKEEKDKRAAERARLDAIFAIDDALPADRRIWSAERRRWIESDFHRLSGDYHRTWPLYVLEMITKELAKAPEDRVYTRHQIFDRKAFPSNPRPGSTPEEAEARSLLGNLRHYYNVPY